MITNHQKSGDIVQLRSNGFLCKQFSGQDGVAINEALQVEYILEFIQSTERDEGFLQVMMIAFITIKSSLVPLIEGLCTQI